MNRVLSALALSGLIAAACGGAGSGAATTAPVAVATTAAPTTPAPTPTVQNQFVFTADLQAANEVPPVTDAEAAGSGTATVTFFTAKDTSGKIIGANATFEFTVKGFPATTVLILSHIHKGDSKTAGGVVIDSGMKATDPIALTTGGTTVTKTNLTVDPVLAADIIANPANYYYNVHSMVHPGGVVRGQLKLKT